jgi:hypothetical protein
VGEDGEGGGEGVQEGGGGGEEVEVEAVEQGEEGVVVEVGGEGVESRLDRGEVAEGGDLREGGQV